MNSKFSDNSASDLGVRLISNLRGASPGAGGATIISAVVDIVTGVTGGEFVEEPVVIKVFPVDCPFRYFKGTVKPNTAVRDYGDYEPGTGLLLTELFIIPSLTQNITTCYNVSVCNQAYDTEVSMCTRAPLPHKLSYPIPSLTTCSAHIPIEETKNPFCPMTNLYNVVMNQGVFEIPARADVVRFMMVEKCSGDIQGLIEGFGKLNLNLENIRLMIDTTLQVMLLMIIHTILMLDSVLNGYSHKDLGARNILYTWDPHQSNNTYWRYTMPSGSEMLSFDINTTSLIPKIWDFAFVSFGTAHQYSQYYSYLNANTIPPQGLAPPINGPTLDRIAYEGRQNDVYILLQDINDLLRKNGITDSRYNKLDLDPIKEAKNDSQAVYRYLQQDPIPTYLLSDETHTIIHNFPPDLSIFNTINLNRNVF